MIGETYGFIRPHDGGPDLFTHISYTGGVALPEGAKVEYQIATDLKTEKPIASEVRVIA